MIASTKNANRFSRYLEYAIAILTKYNGTEPFHLYIKKYFAANKKHGSGDRKQITSLCYNYFRVGFGVSSHIDISQKIVLSVFLIEKQPSLFLETLKPEWNNKVQLPLLEKLEMVKDIFDIDKIFPFEKSLGQEIDFHQFNLSFLIQPKLFIRIRPGYKQSVTDKLKTANILFDRLKEDCFSFNNNQKIGEVIHIDREAVIQDYNSQRVSEFFNLVKTGSESKIKIWDCCAASGGKSILAYDFFKNVELTVSDTRKNILENLHFRFSKARIKNYQSFVADLSVSPPTEGINGKYDLIIADVPCTGSGTWSRTPEQLNFFPEHRIDEYALLQQQIVKNACAHLAEGGYLLYITCSVFKKENEDNVAFIQQALQLKLLKWEYLKGYAMQADTLFAAIFKK